MQTQLYISEVITLGICVSWDTSFINTKDMAVWTYFLTLPVQAHRLFGNLFKWWVQIIFQFAENKFVWLYKKSGDTVDSCYDASKIKEMFSLIDLLIVYENMYIVLLFISQPLNYINVICLNLHECIILYIFQH